MSEFWLGVLSVPVVLVTLALAALAWKWVMRIAGSMAAGVTKLGPEADVHRRAGVAGVMFAAKRIWMFGGGDFGLVILSGQREGERVKAYRRLSSIGLREIKLASRWSNGDAK